MNKLKLTSIFVIWEQFGNKGGLNDTNCFKSEFDFDFKPHGRTCFRFWMEELDFDWIWDGFRFWMEEFDFQWISILRWRTEDFEWIRLILNWVWMDEDEEKWIICRTWRKGKGSNKMKRRWTKNDFILNKIRFF